MGTYHRDASAVEASGRRIIHGHGGQVEAGSRLLFIFSVKANGTGWERAGHGRTWLGNRAYEVVQGCLVSLAFIPRGFGRLRCYFA